MEIVQTLPVYLLPNTLVELMFPASSVQMFLSVPGGFQLHTQHILPSKDAWEWGEGGAREAAQCIGSED